MSFGFGFSLPAYVQVKGGVAPQTGALSHTLLHIGLTTPSA